MPRLIPTSEILEIFPHLSSSNHTPGSLVPIISELWFGSVVCRDSGQVCVGRDNCIKVYRHVFMDMASRKPVSLLVSPPRLLLARLG